MRIRGCTTYNARWYDQEIGRFISEDAGRDPNNPNLFTYCANNPLNNIDPTGLALMTTGDGGTYDTDTKEYTAQKDEPTTYYAQRSKELSNYVHNTDKVTSIMKYEAKYAESGFKYDTRKCDLTVENQIQIYFIMSAFKQKYSGKGGISGLWNGIKLNIIQNQLEAAFKFQNTWSPIFNTFRSNNDKWGPFYTEDQIDAGLQNVGLIDSMALGMLFEAVASQNVVITRGTVKSTLPSEAELSNALSEWARMQKSLAPSKTQAAKFNTATVIYDIETGQYYYGMNRGVQISGDKLNQTLLKILPEKSLNNYRLGNCAEVDAVNQALNNGANINNLYMYTIDVNSGTAKAMCGNCSYTFAGNVANVLSK